MKAKARSARSSVCNDDDYGSHVPTTPPASPDLRSHGVQISLGGDLQATTNYPQEHTAQGKFSMGISISVTP